MIAPLRHRLFVALVLTLDLGAAGSLVCGQPVAAAAAVALVALAAWFAVVPRASEAPPPSPRWLRLVCALLLAYWLGTLSFLAEPPVRPGLAQVVVLALGALVLSAALWRQPAPLLLAGAAVALGTALRLASYRALPIDPRAADMLPVVRGAVDSLLAGRSPYALYQMPGWTVPLAYLPVTWLAYLPARALGLDLRLTNLLLELGIGAVLLGLAGGLRRRAAAWVVLLWAWTFVGAPHVQWSVQAEHAVFWLLLTGTLALVVRGRELPAALLLGLTLAASPLALIPALLCGLHWLRTRPPRRALLLCACAALVVVALILPFVLWAPRDFFDGVVRWHNDNRLFPALKWQGDRTWARMVGLSGLFWAHGLEGLLKPIQAALIALLGWRYLRAGASARDLGPACALGFLLFMIFNPVLWFYLYWPVMAAALVTLAADSGPGAQELGEGDGPQAPRGAGAQDLP